MKNILPGFLLLLMSLRLFGAGRDAQWKKVDDAIQKGLPKTAITNLEPIIQAALHDKDYGEAVKAIGTRIVMEGMVQGNKPEERIVRLQRELAKAPPQMVPIMETLLAEWYWQYFQQNRWRFMQRTATATAPGADFTTWDLPRLFTEVDKLFQKALTADKFLKATPVSQWDALLTKGTVPDTYRPTLYDFIVHEALDFYTSGEQAAARPEDAFEISAQDPVFDSVEKFLTWQPATTDREASAFKAIALYQALLRFHSGDPAPRLAFADADLSRLTWGFNAAFGETKNARYKAALEEFIGRNADFDISALAMEREARVLQQEGDLVAAHTLAQKGAKLFPKSPGGTLCMNLVSEIESKSAQLSTENVWNCFPGNPAPAASAEDCPSITLTYRNIEMVYFRAIPYDWESLITKTPFTPEYFSNEERQKILRTKPALEWSAKLTPTTDYEQKTVQLPAPTTLTPGFYFIVASHLPDFGERDNQLSMSSVWVSSLSLVTRVNQGKLEGFVLDANSGEPLSGAELNTWGKDNNQTHTPGPSTTTDTNGFFSITPPSNRSYALRARYHGSELGSSAPLWIYNIPIVERPEAQTLLFTDRAIYRPGQTLQYKGICLWVDQGKDNYEVLKGEKVSVVFRDVNGKEIARQKQRANDFGSFAGSFTTPRDRLMGRMMLYVEGRATGQAWVNVEEYKRPRFEVTLDPPKTAARLNDKVVLSGHATSYTGAAVDDALVKFHIRREVRMPWWWGWWRGGSAGGSQEIAHGTLHTDTDGSFQLSFVALPDHSVAEQDEPTFVYEINADVTDSAGETRSADRTVRVGYTALEATMSANDWQTQDKPVQLSIHTASLDDEPQVAEGSLKVYALAAPERVHRALLEPPYRPYLRGRGRPPSGDKTQDDLADPNNWALGPVVLERGFTTDTNGAAKLSLTLGTGLYRIILETQDRYGKKVTGRLPVQVLNPTASKLNLKLPHLLAAPTWELQPGDEFSALWGTGYAEGRAFIEIEHRNKMLQRYWTAPGRTQEQLKLAITEAMRGGFTLHVTQVRQNRAYLESRKVEVPWRNKELSLKWEHFVSKLKPGARETWTLRIEPPQGADQETHKKIAEMVATLYDESLDSFASLQWPGQFNFFREDSSRLQNQFGNFVQNLQPYYNGWSPSYRPVTLSYRSFPSDLLQTAWDGRFRRFAGKATSLGGLVNTPSTRGPLANEGLNDRLISAQAGLALAAPAEAPAVAGLGLAKQDAAGAQKPTQRKLEQVAARKNLNETAFFFPQLVSDSNGVVSLTFTMPEALTRWHFLGFAHDQSVRSGLLEGHAVTSKDLMVQPNPPRFLREGDTIEFTVKVSNQSDQPQSGSVRLTFGDALADENASTVPSATDKLLGNTKPDQDFSIPAKQSRSFSWRITVPDGCGYLTYKAVAAGASVSDGEEGALPVLSRRVLVTESLPLPIRGPATKHFEFTRLLKSGSSKSLRSQSLTVQMVSHPAWYAVLALPYLMEYPYECSEQTFNRFYANALARYIANSDPKIHRIFEQWRNTPALESPLEKNQDLKSVSLEETPWLRQAQSESQARKNVGILFDDNRLNYETDRTLQKLAEMQLPDGAWPWFPGGRGDNYITLYITAGFGRLRHLGVDVKTDPALRALGRLDTWMTENYEQIQSHPNPDKYVPSATDALYLYARSFFLKDRPIPAGNQKAVAFFLAQSRKFWLQTGCRQTQGQLALALRRFSLNAGENDDTPAAIMASLKERSVTNEEMGMFWRDTELSWWWYRAPIETQALMIEAFDEVAQDKAAVEECKVWLLKQKQTQDWKTTKATADAVYALLLRGKDLLSGDALVEVKLDGLDVTPGSKTAKRESPQAASVEPGTGFYEVRFSPSEIKPKLGDITVKKTDQGVAWGSVHWQYLEDISKVTPYAGTPLKLTKSLFTKVTTAHGPVLEPAKGTVKVGDELVVRIELRVDRDLEYVHLKDQRGSGTEPVNVLSRYQYQDGLAYYESTRDTASHFFIDYLPKGVYVFEYSTRVQLRGDYQTGLAEIQCMYAPEFNSHSQSLPLVVK